MRLTDVPILSTLSMIRSFRDRLTQDLAAGKARKRVPRGLAERAVRKLFLLDTVTGLRFARAARQSAGGARRRGAASTRSSERAVANLLVWRDGTPTMSSSSTTTEGEKVPADIPCRTPALSCARSSSSPWAERLCAGQGDHVTRNGSTHLQWPPGRDRGDRVAPRAFLQRRSAVVHEYAVEIRPARRGRAAQGGARRDRAAQRGVSAHTTTGSAPACAAHNARKSRRIAAA